LVVRGIDPKERDPGMIKRQMSSLLKDRAGRYPVVTLTGPRQSGKTTISRATFPNAAYVNLEEPDQRDYALSDPREFLARFDDRVIIDEIQRVPDLFSYIQAVVDEEDRPGRFILTGSHNFLLMKSIRQTLAGRAAILHLLPLSGSELASRKPAPLERLGTWSPSKDASPETDLLDVLFVGGYPRIHDKGLMPQDWLANYVRTYIERDVGEILNVGDLEAFRRFVSLCAGRNAQVLNLSSLANDCGITHPTARSWLSVLEAGFLVRLLRPHHRNFNKRLVKSPKLYFLDTGLLCYLLRIRSAEDLRNHAQRGGVFESHVHAELVKNFLNRGLEPDLYFWRDSRGNEVDFVLDQGDRSLPIEVKSARTIAADFFSSLHYWRGQAGDPKAPAALVYGGDDNLKREDVRVYSWSVL